MNETENETEFWKKEQKQNINWKFLTIALLIILLGVVGVFAYQKVSGEIYQEGFEDGQLNFYNQLILTLSQTEGEVTIPVIINNQTEQIKLIIPSKCPK